MEVKLVVKDSDAYKDIDRRSVYVVEQANEHALVNQQSYCKLSGRTVKALVPANVSTVSRQSSEVSFLMLIACYESCINVAASDGAEHILVTPLGIGVELVQVSSLGNVRSDGNWGDLFWTSARSSLAAKMAVENVKQYIPDNVKVTFVVRNENYDEWDWAIDFKS